MKLPEDTMLADLSKKKEQESGTIVEVKEDQRECQYECLEKSNTEDNDMSGMCSADG